jgi:hypothetical protein
MADAVKAIFFWLCLLWLPLVGFSLLTMLASKQAMLGLVIPGMIAAVLGCLNYNLVQRTGILTEDMSGQKPGSGGAMGAVTRAATTSIRRSGSSQSAGSWRADQEWPAGGLRPGDINPQTVGQQYQAQYAGASFPDGLSSGAFTPPQGRRPSIGAKWQYFENGRWLDYEETKQQQFNEDCIRGAKSQFFIRGERFELDFESWKQRNLRTGRERDVRLYDGVGQEDTIGPIDGQMNPDTSGSQAGVVIPQGADVQAPGAPGWQVELRAGQWHDMDANSNTILNMAKANGLTTTQLTIGGHQYDVDLIRCVQTNRATHVERTIRVKPPQSIPTLRGL